MSAPSEGSLAPSHVARGKRLGRERGKPPEARSLLADAHFLTPRPLVVYTNILGDRWAEGGRRGGRALFYCNVTHCWLFVTVSGDCDKPWLDFRFRATCRLQPAIKEISNAIKEIKQCPSI